jgi:hypothetical protein
MTAMAAELDGDTAEPSERERPNYALLAAPVPLPLDALAWARLSGWIIVGDGCWLFDGPTRVRGYGRLGIGHRRRRLFRLAHRVVRAMLVGDTALTLDHTCGVTLCVRPSHLEPVTIDENVEREGRRDDGRFGGDRPYGMYVTTAPF